METMQSSDVDFLYAKAEECNELLIDVYWKDDYKKTVFYSCTGIAYYLAAQAAKMGFKDKNPISPQGILSNYEAITKQYRENPRLEEAIKHACEYLDDNGNLVETLPFAKIIVVKFINRIDVVKTYVDEIERHKR